jgi:hypothetical protein
LCRTKKKKKTAPVAVVVCLIGLASHRSQRNRSQKQLLSALPFAIAPNANVVNLEHHGDPNMTAKYDTTTTGTARMPPFPSTGLRTVDITNSHVIQDSQSDSEESVMGAQLSTTRSQQFGTQQFNAQLYNSNQYSTIPNPDPMPVVTRVGSQIRPYMTQGDVSNEFTNHQEDSAPAPTQWTLAGAVSYSHAIFPVVMNFFLLHFSSPQSFTYFFFCACLSFQHLRLPIALDLSSASTQAMNQSTAPQMTTPASSVSYNDGISSARAGSMESVGSIPTDGNVDSPTPIDRPLSTILENGRESSANHL